MALDLSSPTSPLFKRLGKIIHAAKTLNTARLTTVPTEVLDVANEYNSAALALREVLDGLNDDVEGWRSSGNSLLSALGDIFEDTIIQMVKADNQQETDSIEDALDELITQMNTATATIENTVVAYTTFNDVGTVAANGMFVPNAETAKYANGRLAEFAIAEILEVECIDDSTAGSEVFRIRGEQAVEKMSDLWPLGSGCDVSLRVVSVGSGDNLIANGSFEEADEAVPLSPANWIRGSAFNLEQTELFLTTIPENVVFITGTAVSATYYYQLSYSDGTTTWETEPIAANAPGSTVQSALNAIPPLANVTVVQTGTTILRNIVTFTGVAGNPLLTLFTNYTAGQGERQTISITGSPTGGTFTLGVTNAKGVVKNMTLNWNETASGVDNAFIDFADFAAGDVLATGGPLPGTAVDVDFLNAATNRDIEAITIVANNLTGGTSPTPVITQGQQGRGISVQKVIYGDGVHNYVGARSLRCASSGSETGNIVIQELTNLKPQTQYAFVFALKNSAASPSAGVLTVKLTSSASGTVINDDAAAPNSGTVTLTSIANTNWALYKFIFRTPTALPPVVYINFTMSTALQSGRSIMIDNVVLAEMTQLYAGGPSLAIIGGNVRWRKGDKYIGSILNPRSGEFHEWFNRFLDMEQKGKMLPTAASPTLADGTFIN